MDVNTYIKNENIKLLCPETFLITELQTYRIRYFSGFSFLPERKYARGDGNSIFLLNVHAI